MSLLTIVQDACNDIGILAPTVVVGSTDQQIKQMLALANKEGKALAARYVWQALQLEATFTTVATELQGTITTIAPGFKYIINDTIWNRTLKRTIFGPVSPQRWQQLKSQSLTGPWGEYRIKEGLLRITPVPTAGESCYFEYVSKNWCQSAAAVAQSKWAADADTGILDEDLMTLGLIWRWKQAKGQEYSEDFNTYEGRVLNDIARDGGKPVLSMDGGADSFQPGVMVPAGNWSV